MCGYYLYRETPKKRDSISKDNEDSNKYYISQISTREPSSKQIQIIASLEDFQPLKLLGKGSFGKVILVKYLNKDKIYAMKILKKKSITSLKQISHIKIERLLLEKLNHPFIAKLEYAFQDKKNLYLITEFLQGGELHFHLKRNICFKELTVKFYGAQIFLAIDYLHKNGYIYRDLKPENILIDKIGYLKLTDFGLCKLVSNEFSDKKYTKCGTLLYMAPEIVKGKPYDYNVDWFSFGVVLYQLLSGDFPFKIKEEKIDETIYNQKVEYPEKMSDEAKDIISKLLEIEPQKRLGYNNSDEIKKHPFFQQIDFEQLYNKKYKPIFRPKLTGELDLRYFDIYYIEDKGFFSEELSENNSLNIKDEEEKEEKTDINENKEKIDDDIFKDFSFCKEESEDQDSSEM